MSKKGNSKILYVAILIDTTTSWSRSLIEGILEYSQEHGPWHIHLEPQPRDNRVHLPKNWQVLGLIARISCAAIAHQCRALNLPVVNVSSVPLKKETFPRVITNPKSEAEMSFRALRSRGFRQFAYIGDFSKPYVTTLFDEFNAVLKREGFHVKTYSTAEEDTLSNWLKNLPKPTGALCWGAVSVIP